MRIITEKGLRKHLAERTSVKCHEGEENVGNLGALGNLGILHEDDRGFYLQLYGTTGTSYGVTHVDLDNLTDGKYRIQNKDEVTLRLKHKISSYLVRLS